jgi:hypothetical protein
MACMTTKHVHKPAGDNTGRSEGHGRTDMPTAGSSPGQVYVAQTVFSEEEQGHKEGTSSKLHHLPM